MILVGEAINGLQPEIYKFLLERSKEPIQELARRQAQAGADFIDLNTGTAWLRPAEVMTWLVDIVQEVVPTPLAIDSRRFEVMEAGLRACRNPAMINSTSGEKEKLDRFMDLAARHGAAVVGLTMDEQGIPLHAVGRVAIAKRIMDFAEKHGISRDRLYIDPIVLPLKYSQSQGRTVLEAVRQLAGEKEPPHIIIGLSNVSQGARERELFNRTFLAMATACGLDAVIGNVLDSLLLQSVKAAAIILERQPYSDRFLNDTGKREPEQIRSRGDS